MRVSFAKSFFTVLLGISSLSLVSGASHRLSHRRHHHNALSSSSSLSTRTTNSSSSLPIATLNPSSSLILSPDFEITSTPTTREYNWTIHRALASPDGFEREVTVVNNQFPGPLIEANTGDTIVVHVNNLLDSPQTIHWHGIFQNSTPYMDGVPGISQCPIPANGSFTYQYTITNQAGTYWWHSHWAVTMADGLFGPLIVHSPDETLKRGVDYDHDQIVVVNDWMHDQSDNIVAGLTSEAGYRGTDKPPQGDATLINGIGQASCIASNTTCSPPAPPTPATITLPSNATSRLRLISGASHAMLRVSIDDHPLEVVETDGTEVWGPVVHEVAMSNGERFSVLVNGTEGEGEFWMRVGTAAYCLPYGVEQVGKAIVRFGSTDSYTSTSEPTSQAWDDLKAWNATCSGLDEDYPLVPRVSQSASADAFTTQVFDSVAGVFTYVNGLSLNGFGFNNVSYQNQIYNPLLSLSYAGKSYNTSLVPSVSFDALGSGNLIINNLDTLIDHPYHMHGNSFQIIGRGTGRMDEAGLASANLTLENPLRKDTFWMQRNTWVVLRLVTDNPGVWPMHCHIDWHMAEGKLAVVVVQPDALKSMDGPDSWSSLCDGTDSTYVGPA
ncbi:hypothetical protein I350_07818 [Cryptococcus amylolentus CBS 6273]|nr:hypothetical protein I350_07818 [Cryptococcus amylolentus CBS 6273]